MTLRRHSRRSRPMWLSMRRRAPKPVRPERSRRALLSGGESILALLETGLRLRSAPNGVCEAMDLQTPHRRTVARLRPHRQRRRAQAGALRRLSLHPPRAAGDVAARPRLMGCPWRIRARVRRGWRRPLAVRQARPPRDGWPLGWEDVRFQASCTPFRHLGFFPDMTPVWTWGRVQLASLAKPAIPQPVRLYRRRHAGLLGDRCRLRPCRCFQEVGRAGP